MKKIENWLWWPACTEYFRTFDNRTVMTSQLFRHKALFGLLGLKIPRGSKAEYLDGCSQKLLDMLTTKATGADRVWGNV